MFLKERLPGLICLEGTVESSACVGQTETAVRLRTADGGIETVVTRDDLTTNQAIADGRAVRVLRIPGLKPRVRQVERKRLENRRDFD